jgi:hypothetical protein
MDPVTGAHFVGIDGMLELSTPPGVTVARTKVISFTAPSGPPGQPTAGPPRRLLGCRR